MSKTAASPLPLGACAGLALALYACGPNAPEPAEGAARGLAARAAAMQSRPDTVPAADLHVHIRSQASGEHLARLEQLLGEEPGEPPATGTATSASELIEALDRAGIQHALVLSNAYLFAMPDAPVENEADLVRSENDYLAAEVARFADRLTGACSVNPLSTYALEEIERCAGQLGLPVVKLHLTNSDLDLRASEDVERLNRVFELLDELGAGSIVHMRTRAEDYGAADAAALIDVLARHPGVPVHIAHMAGWGGYDDVTDAALGEFVAAFADGRLSPDHPIWFGLGAVVFQPEAAGADTAMAERVRSANERLAGRIRELGLERVVYATDWPSWPPVAELPDGIAANVRLVRGSSGLTAEELARVFANEGLLRAVAR